MRLPNGDGGFDNYWRAEWCVMACVACLIVGLVSTLTVRSTRCKNGQAEVQTLTDSLRAAELETVFQRAINRRLDGARLLLMESLDTLDAYAPRGVTTTLVGLSR